MSDKLPIVVCFAGGPGRFGPNYTVATKFDNDIIVVTTAEINTMGYTMTPASETSYEIIK